MNEEITGIKLFFHWAFRSCAAIRLNRKEIRQSDFDWMKNLSETGQTPTLELLEKCFPKAFKSYLSFANTEKGKELGPLWSLESVREYWHYHHSHPENEGKIDVWRVPVLRLSGGAVIVLIDKREIPVENYYNFSIKPGDWVYVHKHVITEVAETI
jgi:hypothetical protein